MHNLTCILTLFFALCAVVPGQAATKKKIGWQEFGLKGKVKTVETSSYEIKIVFGESKQVLSSKYIYKYDAAGNKIESACYKADGSLSFKYIYKYDAAGNKIEQANYRADGSLSGKTIFKYDAAGNMIEYAYYNADGSLSSKSIIKYDAAGNRIELVSYKIETKFGQTETVQTGLKKFVYEYYGSAVKIPCIRAGE